MVLSIDSWGKRAPALAGAWFGVIVLAAFTDRIFAADASHLAAGTRQDWRLVSDLGLSGYMFALSGAIAAAAILAMSRAADPRLRLSLRLIGERAVYFFVVIGLSGILVQVLKHIVGRGRPKLLPDVGAFHFEPFSLANVLASFPSGHTTTAFAAAIALSLMFPRIRYALVALAVLIGVSRVCVGDHYPSDVVAGAGLGASVAFVAARAFARRGIAFDGTAPGLVIRRLAPVPAATPTGGRS